MASFTPLQLNLEIEPVSPTEEVAKAPNQLDVVEDQTPDRPAQSVVFTSLVFNMCGRAAVPLHCHIQSIGSRSKSLGDQLSWHTTHSIIHFSVNLAVTFACESDEMLLHAEP